MPIAGLTFQVQESPRVVVEVRHDTRPRGVDVRAPELGVSGAEATDEAARYRLEGLMTG